MSARRRTGALARLKRRALPPELDGHGGGPARIRTGDLRPAEAARYQPALQAHESGARESNAVSARPKRAGFPSPPHPVPAWVCAPGPSVIHCGVDNYLSRRPWPGSAWAVRPATPRPACHPPRPAVNLSQARESRPVPVWEGGVRALRSCVLCAPPPHLRLLGDRSKGGSEGRAGPTAARLQPPR